MIRLLLLILALLWPAIAPAQEPARLDLDGSAITADGDDGLRLSLRLSAPVPYRLLLLDQPKRLVVDMKDLDLGPGDPAEMRGAGLLDGLRGARLEGGWTRLVFQLRAPYAIETAVMRTEIQREAQTEAQSETQTEAPTETRTGAELALRLRPVSAEDYAGAGNAMSALWDLPQPTTPVIDPTRPRPLRVAIDPGHGGVDAGAVEAGLREADLMLEFAHKLTEKLIRAGFEVVLTRRKDVFVGLEARMTEARASNADILISLHADALPDGQAAGAAIFTWNSQADDRASQQLAARHDRADLVAGLNLAGTDDQIAETLMDMARADTQPRSEALAMHLSSEFAQAGLQLHRHPVKGAAYSVLKSPDIPSVLIELGFLTDPGDRANLTDPGWRDRMASAIAEAVTGWSADDSAQADLRRH